MATKFNTSTNYKSKAEYHENPLGKSLTIPNESKSIKQIMKDATLGIAPEIIRRAVYVDSQHFSDLDLSKVKDLDLAEIQDIKNRTKKRIDALHDAMKEKEIRDAEAAQKAAETAAQETPPQ